MTDNKLPTQITIEKASLVKMDSSVRFNLLSEENGTPPFRGVAFNESLFEPSVTGKIFIEDKNSFGELFNITGYEILEMTIKSFDDETSQEFKFHVGEVSEISDSASTTIDGSGGPSTVYTIELQPFEVEYFNTEEAIPDGSSFIGKIADEEGNGLVNNLALRYFSPESNEFSSTRKEMDIEPTLNSIWNKKEQASYPYGKFTGKPHLMQYMNYLTENAISKDNASAANYLFWQDLDQWHFRSIDSLIRDGDPRQYKVNPVAFDQKNTITSFTFTKKINQKELLNSSAFKSYYYHTAPAYYDSYAEYMTTKDKLIRSTVSYDYFKDYDNWSHLEEYQLLPEKLKNESTRGPEIFDSFYGFFNVNEYNDPSPTKFDFTTSTTDKNSFPSWQTMFDQTDMPIDPLKTIKTDVFSADNLDLINQYASKRLLKEKWNVYKYSICCEDQPTPDEKEEVGLGMIVGYDTNDSFTYQYKVAPIEIWTGGTAEQERILNTGTFQDYNFLVVAQSITGGVGDDSRVQTVDAYNITEIFNGPRGQSIGLFPQNFYEDYYPNSIKPEEIDCTLSDPEQLAFNQNEDIPENCQDITDCSGIEPPNEDSCACSQSTGICTGGCGCGNCEDYGCTVVPCNGCPVITTDCDGNMCSEEQFSCGMGSLGNSLPCWRCSEGSWIAGGNCGQCGCCEPEPQPNVIACRETIEGSVCSVEPICSCCCDPLCTPISRTEETSCSDLEDEFLCFTELGSCCPTDESRQNEEPYDECQEETTRLFCESVNGDWNRFGVCSQCQDDEPDPPVFGCCKCTSFGLPTCQTFVLSDTGEDGELLAGLLEECSEAGGVPIFADEDNPEDDPCDQCTAETAPCPPDEDEECCFEGFGGLTIDYFRQFDRYKEDSVIGPVGSLPSITGGATFDCMRYESITSGGFEFDADGNYDRLGETKLLKGTIVRLFRVEKSSLAHISPRDEDDEYIYLFESPQPVNQFMIGEHQGISCGLNDPENGEIPASQCGIKFPASDQLPPLDQGEGGFND